MAVSTIQKNIDNERMRQDISKVELLVTRVETAIIKLTEVYSGVSQLLAVHETKLNTLETLLKHLNDMAEVRRVEIEEKIQVLNTRVSTGEKELYEKIDAQHDKIMTELKDMRKESTTQHEKLSGRITFMEKWMWIVGGGSIVVGFILQTIPWTSII